MKNKKVVSFVLAAAMATTVGLAAGCNPGSHGGDDGPEKLAAPVVSLSGNVISWNAVDHADAYDVYEGTTVVSEAQTACSYTINKTVEGSYDYTVVATSSDENYTDSDKSNVVTYTYSSVDTSTKLANKIYLVGDSTVCSFTDSYYIPRYGYGTQLYNYINCDASQIVNLAASGRSSYSYTLETTENHQKDPNTYKDSYSQLINNISEGDYLIIGFGHNDQKDAIYTNANLDKDDDTLLDGVKGHYASFKYTLYNFYIKVAQDVGATPILCTPIVRASSTNNYSAKSGHVVSASDSGNYPGGDYPKAIRELAEECGISCVDLTALTKADYTALGYSEAVKKYHAYTQGQWADDSHTEIVRKESSVDNTHTNLYGAMVNAYYIASTLLGTDNTLAAHIKTNIVKPEYEDYKDACINSSYKITEYAGFDPTQNASSKWNITAEGWYGTVFGVATSKSTVKQNSENSFTVGTTGDTAGKIASDQISLACVFMQLSANANFKITATVTLDNYYSQDQSGFGIMLRDDIYIDAESTAPNSNYIVAGCYGKTDAATMNFYSVDGARKTAGNNNKTLDTSVTHTLTLERTGTTVKVSFDTYSYTSVTDFELREVDSEHMYLCLFATRDTRVTFSDVVYTYNGEAQA